MRSLLTSGLCSSKLWDALPAKCFGFNAVLWVNVPCTSFLLLQEQKRDRKALEDILAYILFLKKIGFLLQVRTLAGEACYVFRWGQQPTIEGEFRKQRWSVQVISLSQIVQWHSLLYRPSAQSPKVNSPLCRIFSQCFRLSIFINVTHTSTKHKKACVKCTS